MNQGQHTCKACGQSFPTHQALEQHAQQMHSGQQGGGQGGKGGQQGGGQSR